MKRLTAAALLLCAAPLAAQQKAPAKAAPAKAPAHVAAPTYPAMTADGIRALALAQLTYDRSVLIKMADSMPEQYYTESVTPIQRSFAQQIIHCAWAVNAISMGTMKAPGATGLDSMAALTSRTALKAYVNAAYDAADAFAKKQTNAQRAAMTDLFGQKKLQSWQVWEELHQHTMWTAGQVVANFRAHGMAPPEFGFF